MRSMRLRADTHVHFHHCFDAASFLSAAADNLRLETDDSDLIHGAICLTETARANWFEQLTEVAGKGATSGIAGWHVQCTDEPASLIATDALGRRLAIIAGRQIVCQERLEVLALGYPHRFVDGQPIRDVAENVHEAGAVAVIPWGFGKWTGSRGDIVARLLADPPCPLFVGDNAGRLAGLSEPRLFADAKSRGISVLPGTDPFPFAWDGLRVGSYGLEWSGGLDPDAPFDSLKQLMTESITDAVRYGELEGIFGFLRNQTAIQLRSIASRLRK